LPIIADVDKDRSANIVGYLGCSQFHGLKPVNFIVDTGATITTILPFDTLKLGIQCNGLKKAQMPCVTAKGEIYPYMLSDVQVHLRCNDGKKDSFEIFPLSSIHCMSSKVKKKDSQILTFPYSLLGMDILCYFRNWHWDFNDGTLKLDY